MKICVRYMWEKLFNNRYMWEKLFNNRYMWEKLFNNKLNLNSEKTEKKFLFHKFNRNDKNYLPVFSQWHKKLSPRMCAHQLELSNLGCTTAFLMSQTSGFFSKTFTPMRRASEESLQNFSFSNDTLKSNTLGTQFLVDDQSRRRLQLHLVSSAMPGSGSPLHLSGCWSFKEASPR